jgi:hypothetical protein
VVLLIKDMDNPFEGYSTVDLSLLYKLDEYLDNRSRAASTPISPHCQKTNDEAIQ